MRSPRPLPSCLQHPAFATRTAREHGVRASRLLARDIEHPFHGVNTTEPLDDLRARCEAFLTRRRPDQWFSHQTAAALLGVPLPEHARSADVHVTVPYPRCAPNARGVVGRSLTHVEGVVIAGMPMCTPALVWCQLAGILERDDLVAAGDYLVGARRRPALATLSELATACAVVRRTSGARLRAEALPRIRFGADSRPESLLRLLLEEHGYSHLVINEPIAVGPKGIVLRPDLSDAARRIAIEYEGDGHRVDQKQWHHDIVRRDLFESSGWRVIRVTAHDLFVDQKSFLNRLAWADSRFVR